MNQLPTIEEIVKGEFSPIDKKNALNVLLNQQPPASWLKKHPMASGVKYLPIDKVEYLLTKIFHSWSVEIKNIQVIANSAVVTIRLHYVNPLDLESDFQDGVGAAPIHTKKGSGAMEWDQVNPDSVMKAVPAAESYAVKDAAEKLGRLFGKDLNRKDLLNYDSLTDVSKFKNAEITEK